MLHLFSLQHFLYDQTSWYLGFLCLFTRLRAFNFFKYFLYFIEKAPDFLKSFMIFFNYYLICVCVCDWTNYTCRAGSNILWLFYAISKVTISRSFHQQFSPADDLINNFKAQLSEICVFVRHRERKQLCFLTMDKPMNGSLQILMLIFIITYLLH